MGTRKHCPICDTPMSLWSDGTLDLLQCDDPKCSAMVTTAHYPMFDRAARLLAAVERLEETANPVHLSYLLDTWYSDHAGFLAPTMVDALISLGET